MARLAFFGTPDFSLPCLRMLDEFCRWHGHELVMVVTQRDMPKGRGKKLLPSPVKELALKLGIEIFQPSTLKKGTADGDGFFERFLAIDPDLAVVIAYGRIIPERLLRLPRRGFVNIHASLLPRFRGAAPIQRAIEMGDRLTGVCLMQMVKGLDEGDVFACRETPILPFDTSGTLSRRLSVLGADLLRTNLSDLLSGQLKKAPQAREGVCYAHMLKKEEGLLDFRVPGQILRNRAQAFDPWPGLYGFIRGRRIKFFDAFFIKSAVPPTDLEPGRVVAINSVLGVRTIDGVIYFRAVQIEGRRIMSVEEAMSGFPVSIGEKITRVVAV